MVIAITETYMIFYYVVSGQSSHRDIYDPLLVSGHSSHEYLHDHLLISGHSSHGDIYDPIEFSIYI